MKGHEAERGTVRMIQNALARFVRRCVAVMTRDAIDRQERKP